MVFKHTNRTNPERVFVVGKASVDLAIDQICCVDHNDGSVDGVNVVLPAVGLNNSFIGLADTAISSGNYGLIQVYGLRRVAIVRASASSGDGVDADFYTVTKGNAIVAFSTFEDIFVEVPVSRKAASTTWTASTAQALGHAYQLGVFLEPGFSFSQAFNAASTVVSSSITGAGAAIFIRAM
jgi:hypothetical protein